MLGQRKSLGPVAYSTLHRVSTLRSQHPDPDGVEQAEGPPLGGHPLPGDTGPKPRPEKPLYQGLKGASRKLCLDWNFAILHYSATQQYKALYLWKQEEDIK